MDFLTLCRRAAQDCDITGESTIPTAVTGQTGMLQKLVNWVIESYVEIQNSNQNWRWMRRPFTLNTVADDGTYEYGDCTDVDAGTAITRFKRWWANDPDRPFTIYRQSTGVAGEGYLTYLEWPYFRDQYRRGAQTSGPPIHVSVDDQNRLCFGPKPDAVYVVQGDFQRSAQRLAANDDEPEMPEDFHTLIVYMAMMKYAGDQSAPEVYDTGNAGARLIRRQLEADQMPSLVLAPPLC